MDGISIVQPEEREKDKIFLMSDKMLLSGSCISGGRVRDRSYGG